MAPKRKYLYATALHSDLGYQPITALDLINMQMRETTLQSELMIEPQVE